ncbi:MAG: DUF642 domain-containing protein [Candidatus Latescibacteria bacterium]|nr:DUF642 domain-containing protein [Candidatus Latescibacterota bacterium]
MTPLANMVTTYSNGYSSAPGNLLALDSAYGGDGTYGFRVALPAGADMVSVDTAGDINGDGFDDFAINTRTHPENSWYAVGVAYIVYGGRDFGASLDLENLDGSNGFRITGDPNALGLGVSVSGAGDLNGDGLDDLVVSDQKSWSSGHAYVIYGQNTSASLMGDAGDNDLTLHGGPEAVVQAGSGDDTIRISSTEFFRIDGDGGTDTLELSGNGTTLDFSQFEANAVQGIEVIDLGNGGNSLYITPRQAAAITDGKVLQIDGDTSDHVTLLQGSVRTVGAEYTTYKFGGIEIQVANTIGEVREINVAPHFLGTVARVPENQTTVTFPVVDDNGDTGLTYAIAGGADASKFTIDPATGLLSFKSTPNFEAPADAGADNVYEVRVSLSDGVASRIQDLQVTVTNLNEAPSILLASAASGQIANGSFETPDLGGASGAPLFGQNPSTPGWWGVYVNHVGSAWQAADGAQSVDLSANPLLGEGRVQQTLQTVPGVQYTVTFNFTGSPGYGPSDLEVYTSQDNGLHAITSKEYSFDQANSASDMRWQEETFTFVATGTSTTLVFASRDGQSEGGPALDNVRVSEGGFVTNEDTPVVITGMSITDPDDNPAATISVDLFVGHGSLEPINPSGANVSYYDDASVTHLVLWGSLSQINAALSEGIRYTPDANYNQSDSLAIGVYDGLEAHATIEITVNPVADADVFELPVLIEPVFINGGWQDFGALIASYGGPRDITAFSKGWLDYDTHYYAGPHTLVRIDYDGGGDNYVNYTPAWGSVLIEPVVDPTKVYPDNPLHNFTLDGPNADKLDFSTLLDSVGAPHDDTAFSGGWLDFEYDANAGNTVIRFDGDGGGDEYVPILTLVGVELTESDTAHYQL